MKNYKIPCSWQMYGYVTVEAESLDDAILIAEGDDVSLPDGEYVSGSFEIDYDLLDDEN